MKDDILYYILNVILWILLFKYKWYKVYFIRLMLMPWFAIGKFMDTTDEVAFIKLLGGISIIAHSFYIVIIIIDNFKLI